MLRPCIPADAARICSIYNHYILETVVTFEEIPVQVEEMARRIADVTSRLPWLVYEWDGEICGYAYAGSWKERSAYRYSVESTVYLAPHMVGQGIGTLLYSALLEALRTREVHCAIGGIALPNPASVALHEKLGFTSIGQFREVGWKFEQWVDVGYWEILL
ncbi:MAG: arsinothricin resistance N-acetyltransferase ArsN1 family B [Steroidobacteraceae bacterium]